MNNRQRKIKGVKYKRREWETREKSREASDLPIQLRMNQNAQIEIRAFSNWKCSSIGLTDFVELQNRKPTIRKEIIRQRNSRTQKRHNSTERNSRLRSERIRLLWALGFYSSTESHPLRLVYKRFRERVWVWELRSDGCDLRCFQ